MRYAVSLVTIIACVVSSHASVKPILPGGQNAEASSAIVCTFDDGPRSWITPRLLDFLKAHNMRCTFFVLAMNFEHNAENQELLKRAVRDGHEIANHTYWHARIPEFVGHTVHGRNGKEWFLDDQLERSAKAIASVTGVRPRFFRPRSWDITEFSRAPMPCEAFRAAFTGGSPPRTRYPSDILYKEELICEYGYVVQVLDRYPALAPNVRALRDVNTRDYEFHARYKKDPKGASGALVAIIRDSIAWRERSGIRTHILGMHELLVTLDALNILVPEWEAKGYRMITLKEAYGL